MKTKISLFLIAGIILCISHPATSGNLLVKHSGTVVYSVNQSGIISFAKGVVENSTTPAGTQALKLSRSAEKLLWTAGADQVNIKGQFIDPVTDTASWIMFRNSTTGKRAAVTDDGDIPIEGGEQNLVREDIYLDDHIIENDVSSGSGIEYCNFGDGRIEYSKTGEVISENNYFYIKDHLGTTRVTEKSNGSVAEFTTYDAYGAILRNEISGAEDPTKNKFTGKEYDREGAEIGVLEINFSLDFALTHSDPNKANRMAVYFTDAPTDPSKAFILFADIDPISNKGRFKGAMTLTANREISSIHFVLNDETVSCVVQNINEAVGPNLKLVITQTFSSIDEFQATVPKTFVDYNRGVSEMKGIQVYYFGARYYDPEIGFWTSTDPGDEYYSPFLYVGNNPVNALDPNGLWTLSGGFGLGYALTGKIGYNSGNWTFGFGMGEGTGGIVKFNPATVNSFANNGITTELRVVTKAEVGLGKNIKFGGSIEASVRSDQAGNYVNRVKGDLVKGSIRNNSAKLSYEMGERGNMANGLTESYDKYSVSQEASLGAFQFMGAEVDVGFNKFTNYGYNGLSLLINTASFVSNAIQSVIAAEAVAATAQVIGTVEIDASFNIAAGLNVLFVP